MSAENMQSLEFELELMRTQLERTTEKLHHTRREVSALAKDNAVLRTATAKLEHAYLELESRFISLNEAELARITEETRELSTLAHAIRSGKFWKMKSALARLRRRPES